MYLVEGVWGEIKKEDGGWWEGNNQRGHVEQLRRSSALTLDEFEL